VLAKADKPDFEAALEIDGRIVVLGSGSTPRRCHLAFLDVDRRVAEIRDRADLYAELERALGTGERPNIEGAVAAHERVELFHRGSGAAPSAILEVSRAALLEPAVQVSAVHYARLGAIDGVPLHFTDAAALPGGRVAFLAAAENTPDAIADGPVMGSVLGVLDATRSHAVWTRILDADGKPYRQKAEGLVIDAGGDGAFILTDADDAAIGAELGRLALVGFA
jgi:hypothetical protein